MDNAIAKRKKVAQQYREKLKSIPGISILEDMENVKHNYSYFPILVDTEKYGISRDELYEKLKEENIFGRRYFYPLISDFSTYRGLPSASKDNLPVANRIADSVICLPIHHEVDEKDINRIIEIIKTAGL